MSSEVKEEEKEENMLAVRHGLESLVFLECSFFSAFHFCLGRKKTFSFRWNKANALRISSLTCE